ncbi:hypothetical protein [Roseobacter weihaiensis]|uniref:hypothetical protein n=1 Tax=Roseobacter weihaiensis TaxID=2763262 RepID=UPI001D0A6C6F|nr:hypothetical protein [Roseobacter sp. H9]
MRIRLTGIFSMALLLAIGPDVQAQQTNSDEIARMLVTDLSPTASMESGQWLTDTAHPAEATGAVGIIYVHIPGSAGSVSIHAGLYSLYRTGWLKERDVTGLFGMSPSDAVFLDERVELTTLTLGPNDPRCCPTQRQRWSIDRRTGAAIRLN